MACCQPFTMYKPKLWAKNTYLRHRYPNGVQIPCGYCLNCRVDKRNQWSDRCKYEYKQKLTGSFVTLTYSDLWLPLCSHYSPHDGSLVARLNYQHVRKFIHRIRAYIKSHPELHCSLCRPDFSYIYVGEYGEKTKILRPHYHILFFGLDFAYMKDIFRKEWPYGIIDSLPILDGGINYVLKYLDKQLFGEQAKQVYDLHMRPRPKRISSKSFGARLYYDNKIDIKSHNFTYKSGKVRRPVPGYFLKKLFGRDFSIYNNPEYLASHDKKVNDLKRVMRDTYKLKDVRLPAQRLFSLQRALIRERKLRQKILDNGIGVYDFTLDDMRFGITYDSDKIRSLPPDISRWLSTDYINQLSIGVSNGS